MLNLLDNSDIQLIQVIDQQKVAKKWLPVKIKFSV